MTSMQRGEKERILVSACLLGVCCRYDGTCRTDDRVRALLSRYILIPVCPEQLGGLSTPRGVAEIVRGRVLTRSGQDVTPAFVHGARQALELGELFGCRKAVLMSRSPSCGSVQVYDGSFTGRLVPGQGIFASLLAGHGYQLFDSDTSTHTDSFLLP